MGEKEGIHEEKKRKQKVLIAEIQRYGTYDLGAWIIRGVVGRKEGVGQAGRFVAYCEFICW